MGHYVTGSLWNKHSGTLARYKSSKWKKLKSQERFWKWFMIGGALRSAFIVTGTSPFTSLRWETRSASLPISWALPASAGGAEASSSTTTGARWVVGGIWALQQHPTVVRIRFAQPAGERAANLFWHFKYVKRHQLWGGVLFFFLLQLHHNHAPKCTYKHFITWIWNNAWKINLRIVPKQKVFLPK